MNPDRPVIRMCNLAAYFASALLGLGSISPLRSIDPKTLSDAACLLDYGHFY